MPVHGIGGLFFRAQNPEALASWYREHLGVGSGCAAEGAGEPKEWVWMTNAGPVVFAPFKHDTDYFAADKTFMINFRVSDLAEMVERLRASGIEVVTKSEWNDPAIGNFARVHDPDGNAIELWERSCQTNCTLTSSG